MESTPGYASRRKCFYYKCEVNSYSMDMKKEGIALFSIPSIKRYPARHREFLERMNIANYPIRIPEVVSMRICSRHFKPEDMRIIPTLRNGMRLCEWALPHDWKDVYPDEVDVITNRLAFRKGDDIVEYLDEQRAFKDGKPRIEHDYAKEQNPHHYPGYVTRTEVELVRYVRTSLTVKPTLTSEERRPLFEGVPAALADSQDDSVDDARSLNRDAEHQQEQDELDRVELLDLWDCDEENNEEFVHQGEWNQETVVPKERVCRACGQEKINMVNIFSTQGRTLELSDIVNKVLPIKVHELDDLPLQMCMTCIDQITVFGKLYDKVAEADKALKKTYHVPDVEQTDPLKTIMEAAGIEKEDCGPFDQATDHADDFDDGNDAGNIESDNDDSDLEDQEEDSDQTKQNSSLEHLYARTNAVVDSKALKTAIEGSKDINFEPHYNELLCATCNTVTTSPQDFVVHNANWHQRNLVYCPLCVTFFVQGRELDQHWRIMHAKTFRDSKSLPTNPIAKKLHTVRHKTRKRKKPQQWSCSTCGEKFTDVLMYKEHLKKELALKRPPREPIFKCDYCDEKFTTNGKCFTHMLSAHKEFTPYECPHCQKRFKVKSCFRDHVAMHTQQANVLCNQCGKLFISQMSLRSHERTHLPPVPCTKCSKLVHPDQMKHHLIRHERNSLQAFLCSVCNRSYPSQLKLLRHKCKGSYQRDVVKPAVLLMAEGTDGFMCSFCEKVFPRTHGYLNHLKTHTDEADPLVTCSVCRFTANKIGILAKHLESHPECLRFSCPNCPKKFSTAKRRHQHLYNTHHMGEPPSQCQHCDKMVEKYDWEDHMNRHSGARPYSCKICTRTYFSQKALEMHEQRSKPVNCDVCSKSFCSLKYLSFHIRTHTATKVFQCSLCDFSCLHRRSLKYHTTTRHAEYELVEEEETIDDKMEVVVNTQPPLLIPFGRF